MAVFLSRDQGENLFPCSFRCQNLVLSGCRTEVSVSLLVVSRGPPLIPRNFPLVLAHNRLHLRPNKGIKNLFHTAVFRSSAFHLAAVGKNSSLLKIHVIGLTWIIQNNLISRSLTLISLQSLLPCKVIFKGSGDQEMGIRGVGSLFYPRPQALYFAKQPQSPPQDTHTSLVECKFQLQRKKLSKTLTCCSRGKSMNRN